MCAAGRTLSLSRSCGGGEYGGNGKRMNHKLAFKRAENADSPLYMQVADTLRSLIDNRILRPGEKIPPTRELRDTFEVSTITAEAVGVCG